jgi:hypothetical protein
VWTGLCGDKVLGPFLFENNLNSELYLNFLNQVVEILLARLPHNGRDVCDFSDREFPEKWIGNSGEVAWLNNTPFFLWVKINL